MVCSRRFVLTSNLLKVLTKKGILLVCIKCERPLKEGDKVVSRSDRNHTKHYHESCWESLFDTFSQPKYVRLLYEDHMF